MSSSFDQEFNTYQWSWRALLSQRVGEEWEFRLSDRFISSLLSPGGGTDRWKDDHSLEVAMTRPLFSWGRLELGTRALRFWDRQSGLPNDFSRQEVFLGLRANDLRRTFASFEIGPAHEIRYNKHDWGPRWQLRSELRNLETQGYRHDVSLVWSGHRLGKRDNNDQRILYLVGREFQAGAADSLRIGWDRYRRDYYSNPSLDREQMIESSAQVENRLHYQLPLNLRAHLKTTYTRESVEVRQVAAGSEARSRRRVETGLANLLRLSGTGRRLTSEVELEYREHEARYVMPRVEEHTPFSRNVAFVAPDNVSAFLALSARVRWASSGRDSATVFVRASKLQYDTPDTSNYDDHDQVRYDAAVVWKHYLNRQVKVETRLGAGLYHLVYIFGERSGDNHWNRVLRLAPSVEVRPSAAIRFLQRFEVSANYVDYDFESPLQLTRSYVFRRFLAEDSLRARIDEGHILQVAVRHQLEESGRLYWDEFSERPLTGRSEWRIRGVIRKQWKRLLWLEVGFSYYDRRESRFEIIPGASSYHKVPAARYIAKGPLLGFFLERGTASTIYLYVQRQKVSSTGNRTFFTNFISILVNWEL